MKIISWNINGIRAIEKKGFLNWLNLESPDILAVQEIKAKTDQLSQALTQPDGYFAYFNPAQRPGYSGTAIYTKEKPLKIDYGFGSSDNDHEGRVLSAEFKDFILFNIYFPNGKAKQERLDYKLEFYDAALKHFDKLLKKGKKLIITGDYNTAHKELDLTHPKANEDVSGFLKIERAWLNKLVEHGYVDCFREFDKEGENYTWWSMRTRARDRNVGWRIDYFFVSKNLKSHLTNCYHLTDVMGSDHCPVALEIT
jgi:exodeoxyribonuclease III